METNGTPEQTPQKQSGTVTPQASTQENATTPRADTSVETETTRTATGPRRQRLEDRLTGIDGKIGEINTWMQALPKKLWDELKSQSVSETIAPDTDGHSDGTLPRNSVAGTPDVTTNSQQTNQANTTNQESGQIPSNKPRSVFQSRNAPRG